MADFEYKVIALAVGRPELWEEQINSAAMEGYQWVSSIPDRGGALHVVMGREVKAFSPPLEIAPGDDQRLMPDGQGLELLGPGRLLVANPLLPDPNFDRTVVLLLAYGDEGALGLVLNRPSETMLAAPLPRWEHLAASPAVVFVGGPVQHQAVICLARALGHPAAAVPPHGWSAVLPEVGTLDLDLDPEGLQASFSEVRVFAGYAGWTAGQLEAEIGAGAWWILDAEADDPFCEEPEDLWKRVLRRQSGSLALVAAYPDDPMLN